VILGIHDFVAFVASVLVFLMLPGPGTLALLNSTGKRGCRAGAAATLGLIVGDQLLLWLAVGGVAALLQTSPPVFRAVQYAGAAYLAFLGLRLVFAREAPARTPAVHTANDFRRALLITLLNPKAIVFYMAFFPLFIDPQTQKGVATFAAMAVTIAALTLVYCLTLVALAGFLAERVRAHGALTRTLEKLAGIALVGFSIKLTQ
jgi:leucine efflux protein